jgi:hypothetical protein
MKYIIIIIIIIIIIFFASRVEPNKKGWSCDLETTAIRHHTHPWSKRGSAGA